MRFLICLRGEKLSRPTLHFAATMAGRLSTDITVLFVAPGVRRSFSPEAEMVREMMNEWALDSPGNEVLRAARDHLEGIGFIRRDEERESYREVMAPGAGDALELQLVGRSGENVAFRYRQGDALEEILAELQTHRYDLLVIGSGAKRSPLVEKLLQFSEPSVLVVKNPRDIRYKVLACTDATPNAHRAELLAIKTASFLNMELTFLSVVKSESERTFMEKHLERMSGLCDLKSVPHRTVITEGNIVQETVRTAGDDHIIFLGRSRRGALKKLIMGSKAIKIIHGVNCPILAVK
jgi:nucleotide-binding universal stress UspA family protein